jgi:fructose transport system permease protein
MPAIVALVAGFALGAICGYANGFLVARLRLPPFIVTLGTWNIVMAIYQAPLRDMRFLLNEKVPT